MHVILLIQGGGERGKGFKKASEKGRGWVKLHTKTPSQNLWSWVSSQGKAQQNNNCKNSRTPPMPANNVLGKKWRGLGWAYILQAKNLGNRGGVPRSSTGSCCESQSRLQTIEVWGEDYLGAKREPELRISEKRVQMYMGRWVKTAEQSRSRGGALSHTRFTAPSRK